jgi:anti-sigma factor RsiW
MNCADVCARLDDWVDRELAAGQQAEVAQHLAECPSCAAEVAELRGLVDAASALRLPQEPARDLWPGIRRRIESRGSGQAAWERWGGAWRGAAVAAALVIAIATGVLIGRGHQAAVASRQTEVAAVPAVLGAGDQDGALARGAFAAARHELWAAFAARRASLSPATVREVERNLATIDDAVAQIDRALTRDPGDPQLSGLLVATLRLQIELLQRAATLPEQS